METYFWKIKYYNDFLEKDMISCGTIGAKSYGAAVCEIEKKFGNHSNIDEIVIYESDFCDGFTFFEDDEELWNHLLKGHKEF